jgi:hypothetical protein
MELILPYLKFTSENIKVFIKVLIVLNEKGHKEIICKLLVVGIWS